jgi:hypothetical protein
MAGPIFIFFLMVMVMDCTRVPGTYCTVPGTVWTAGRYLLLFPLSDNSNPTIQYDAILSSERT